MKVLLHHFFRLSAIVYFLLGAGYTRSQTPVEAGPGNILYVDISKKDVPGHTPSGNSWANALPELADALWWARQQWETSGEGAGWDEQNPLKIFVAKGVYKPFYCPNSGDDVPQHKTFLMVPSVEIYGGFDPENGITNLNHQRVLPGLGGSGTVLSGDLNGDDSLVWDEMSGKWIHLDRNDNVFQVVLTVHDREPVVLDGVEISGGNAVGNTYGYVVDDVSVNRNRGGGIFTASPVLKLRNSLVRDNVAASMGGGIFIAYEKGFEIFNAAIIQNTSHTWGGGIYSDYSSFVSRLTQVTIAGNHAESDYAAIRTDNAQIQAYNSIILGSNHYGIGGSIQTGNCLVEGRFSISAGNIPWNSNFTPEDFFRNPGGGDYSLRNSSLLVNAGNNSYYIQADGNLTNDTDLLGNPRLSDGTIDVGAFEYLQRIIPDGNNILYVDRHVSGGNGTGESWENALPELADALKWAREQWEGGSAPWEAGDPLKIFVAKGTYKPLYNAADGAYTQDGGRDNAFVLIPNVQIFGGFDPQNNSRELSDPRILPAEGDQGTVLSGIIDESDDVRVFHVVVAAGEMGNALLNGISIVGGYADGGFNDLITVRQEPEIRKFAGGGVYNVSNIRMEQVHIRDNYGHVGGAWLNLNGEPFLKNVRIYDNQSRATSSAWYNNDGNPTLVNVFIKHASYSWYQANGAPLLVNTTLLGRWFLGTSTEPARPTLQNSLMPDGFAPLPLNDEDLSDYTQLSTVVGNQFYNENGLMTPLHTDNLVDLITGIPLSGSPVIGAGNSQFYADAGGDPNGDADLNGNPRLRGCRIDLGAFEADSPDFADAAIANVGQQQTLFIPAGGSSHVFASGCDHLIASVATDESPHAVAGNVTARVWIRTEQPSRYVRRHYELMPETNAEESTARVTLYFTNEEFREFNQSGSPRLLPDAEDPATIAERKHNIIIEKRSGVSEDLSGDPDSYTGEFSNLYPQAEDVVWNPVQRRWEITFDVQGFSGFFIKTTEEGLPVNLIYFSASVSENLVTLEWKTSEEKDFSHFVVEYSTDGVSFSPLGDPVPGVNQNGLNFYSKQHMPEREVNYYRLKMTDQNGQFVYSRIEVVQISPVTEKTFLIYPNPAKSVIQLKSPGVGLDYHIYNAAGLICGEGRIEKIPQPVDISRLPAGIYRIRLGDQSSQFVKP